MQLIFSLILIIITGLFYVNSCLMCRSIRRPQIDISTFQISNPSCVLTSNIPIKISKKTSHLNCQPYISYSQLSQGIYEMGNVDDNIKKAMLDSIKWYRGFLSPLMPPNCRFFPSCSVYAIDAINQFGPYKGLILIAWRIFRCNPIGGSGYDPPRWPPPPYYTPPPKLD